MHGLSPTPPWFAPRFARHFEGALLFTKHPTALHLLDRHCATGGISLFRPPEGFRPSATPDPFLHTVKASLVGDHPRSPSSAAPVCVDPRVGAVSSVLFEGCACSMTLARRQRSWVSAHQTLLGSRSPSRTPHWECACTLVAVRGAYQPPHRSAVAVAAVPRAQGTLSVAAP